MLSSAEQNLAMTWRRSLVIAVFVDRGHALTSSTDLSLESLSADLSDTVAALTRRLLETGRTEHVVELGIRTASLFEAAASGLGALIGSERPAVCAAGCSWCCHPLIVVNAPAVFVVAEAVRGLPADRQRDIKRKIALYRADNLGIQTVPRPPCALLGEDGRCGIYDARPLVCRAHNSTNVEACKRRYSGQAATIEGEPAPLEVKAAVEAGLLTGMRSVGRQDGFGLEFMTALDIALTIPDCAERWLANLDPFAPARLPDHILALAIERAKEGRAGIPS